MDEKQKEGILAFIRLYPLILEQMAAAVEQISAAALLLKAYLHRYDICQGRSIQSARSWQ